MSLLGSVPIQVSKGAPVGDWTLRNGISTIMTHIVMSIDLQVQARLPNKDYVICLTVFNVHLCDKETWYPLAVVHALDNVISLVTNTTSRVPFH